MSHPKQDEIDHAFATALELPDEELSVWLAQQPDAVREEVESLLAAWRRSEDFLGDETGGQTAGPDFTRRMQAVLARVAAARSSQSGQHRAQLPGSGERTGLTPLNNGTRIGPYQIEGVLGRGGMGVVYRALDTKLNRLVALKFLADDVADTAYRRFHREAQMASSLNHPHIITVHDAGEHDGQQYLVTEYLDGGTLTSWAKAKSRTSQEVVELLAGVADGIATAHGAGMLHRDIKPGNILILGSGHAKLADFGLATLREGSAPVNPNTAHARSPVIGTIAYMSPEQASGRPLDVRSDIFSFGVVLYEMLAGRRPFDGATDLEVLQRIIQDTAPHLGEQIPRCLRTVVEKALEKRPADRYQSMQEMVTDLRRCARQAGEAPTPRRPPKFWRVGLPVLIGLVLITAAITVFRSRQSVGRARPEYTKLTNFPDSVTSPALSADGRMLTFIRGSSSFVGTGQIWVKFLPDGALKQLTRDDMHKMSPVFSPDGSRIAYTTIDESGGWNTHEVPVVGGDPKLLLTNAAGLIWQARNRVIFSKIIAGDGSHMKIVAAEESRAGVRDVYIPMPKGAMAHRSWPSPDEQWVLVAEMDERGAWLPCRLIPIDGSSTGTRVGPSGDACWFAAWSPDGKWMYFNSSVGGGFHIWRQRFSRVGDFSEPEQITSGATEEEGIAIAPDGRALITAVGMKQGSVWVRDSTGERQISLEGVARQPKFTPDGSRLLYLVEKSGWSERRELWIADLKSGRTESLLPGFAVGGDDVRPPYDISPDGRQVVLEARDGDGRRRLWIAPLDRRSFPRRIGDVEGDGPLFGPAGEIYFRAREGDYGFPYRVEADGTGLRKVSNDPVYSTISVSPDGAYLIVYARASEHQSGLMHALPLRSGPVVPIYGRFLSMKWSRDGTALVVSVPASFYSGQTGKTYVLPLARGRSLPNIPAEGFPSETAIARMAGAPVVDSPDVAPGPSAEVFAFSRVTVQRNLYRVPVP